MNEKKEPKHFRVIGIDRKKLSMVKYGQGLEDALNQMKAEGYRVKVFNIEEKGTILMGELGEEEEQPRGIMFPISLGGVPPIPNHGMATPIEFKNSHTPQVVHHVLRDMNSVQDEDKKKEMLDALAEQLLKEIPVPEVQAIMTDCENLAEKHDQIHKEKGEDHGECDAPEVLRDFAKHLKTKIQARLQ